MDKKLIRLTESDLHRIVKESVRKVINEIGNTDKYYGDMGYTMGYNDAMRCHGETPEEREMGRKKADRAMSLSTRLQKHQNNGELYDVHSKKSAAQYRANTNASNRGYESGWGAFMKERGL